MAHVISTALGQGKLGDVLDLCCGTGSVGAAISEKADHISGVDISSGMLEKARQVPDLMLHLPDEREIHLLPRQWLANVIYTRYGQ